MRVVLDVNVWISALLWGGVPAQLLHLAKSQEITIFVSEDLLEELEVTLNRVKFTRQLQKRGYSVNELIEVTRGFSEQCSNMSINVPQLRDPKDNKIIAAALSADAEVLISGDLDLLTLQEFSGIRIVTPTDFINLF